MTNLPVTNKFQITATYGQQGKYWANGHKGIDFVADNKNIYATCDGVVRVVSYDANGWGQYVSIGDAAGQRHLFCHLVKGSVLVKVGQSVTRDTIIGIMGTTGNSTGVHLHYQINDAQGNPKDPCTHLGIPNKVGQYNSADYSVTTKYVDDAKIASWAKDDVYRLKSLGIMNGDTTGNFNPTANITRQEIAVVIDNLCDRKGYFFPTTIDNTKYKDHKNISSWAVDKVYELRREKIMCGDDKGRFNPKNNITRQEAAQVFYNVYGKAHTTVSIERYTDDKDIASWARKAVYNLKAAKIMQGNSLNQFNPKNHMTRQEAAVAVCNLMDKK